MANFRSVNYVLIVGRVGTIYDRRKSKGKPGPINISVATSEIFREGKQRTDWHRISFWGAAADFVEKYVAVGSLVAIEAKLHTSSRKNADGSISSYVNVDGVGITSVIAAKGEKDRGQDQPEQGEAEEGDDQPDDQPEDNPEDNVPF